MRMNQFMLVYTLQWRVSDCGQNGPCCLLATYVADSWETPGKKDLKKKTKLLDHYLVNLQEII